MKTLTDKKYQELLAKAKKLRIGEGLVDRIEGNTIIRTLEKMEDFH